MQQTIGEQVAELPYTYRYFRELSPAFLSLALLNQRIAFDANRSLRYLELGFGQGVSLNVHAAVCAGEFWGNDFNPAHVEHARGLAQASGAQVHITGETFEQLSARDDLPEFDVIVLHGIWTWVSARDRAAIIDLAGRKLAPGGLLYVSYNCIAGWGAALGLRELVALHAARGSSAEATILAKVDGALNFANDLARAGAAYFKDHPHVVKQLEGMLSKDRAYLAHELLGSDWHLTSHAQVSSELSAIGMTYGASAMLLMHNDAARFGPEAAALLAGLSDRRLREAAREMFANTPFREDIFIKGEPQLIPPAEHVRMLGEQRFVLTARFGSMPPKMSFSSVEVNLETELNAAILRALRSNFYAPKSLVEIAAAAGRAPEEVWSGLIDLIGVGFVQPVRGCDDPNVRTRSRNLNAFVCSRAALGGKVSALASPVLGAGLQIGRLEQLFLLSLANGRKTPGEQAEFVFQALRASGGAQGRLQAEVQAELTSHAQEFATGMLPILRAIEIV